MRGCVLRFPLVRGANMRRGLAVATSLLLAACNLGPEYKRPEVPIPAAWHENSANETVNWPAADWWHGFGSPELDTYINQARRVNYDLVAAVARVQQADALATVAGAALLPTLGLNFSALNEREQTTANTYAHFRQYSPQLSASYMLDFWGKNRAAQTAAIATATASRHDKETVELTVVTSVALTYFQSVELRDRLVVARGNLASAETTLRGLRRQLAAGIATALDVAQQETTVATLEAEIPPLNQQFVETLDALAILIGKQPEAVDITTGTLTDLAEPAVGPSLPSELLARRPDVAQAEAQLIAANANIAAARAAFFPTISLTADGGFVSSSLSHLFN
ncbi:MAG TPA: efflux transporter outer membrane subunit, partial [Burkholderiaceae bacterium]|nr:efflux transporter outer membrane subunit [Burkholderiaceae bacterium]